MFHPPCPPPPNPQVRLWRGSYGLLGIATALQISIKPAAGFQMRQQARTFSTDWNAGAVTPFLEGTAAGAVGVEWFFNPWSREILALIMAEDATDNFDAASTIPFYTRELAGSPDLAYTGAEVNAQGALAQGTYALLSGALLKAFSVITYAEAMSTIKQMWTSAAAMPRDGFYIFPSLTLTHFHSVQTYILCPGNCISDGKLWATFEATRVVLEPYMNALDGTWYPNLCCEARLASVKNDTLVLEHLSPGSWISMECLTLAHPKDQDKHEPAFAALERAWQALGPFSVHHGKVSA